MVYQVVYRTPGSQWELWQGPLTWAQVEETKLSCRRQTPAGTMVGVIQGWSSDALLGTYGKLVEGTPVTWYAPPEMTEQDRRRLELEAGPGNDHDEPWPPSVPYEAPTPVLMKWAELLAKVQRGELEP